MEFELNKNNTGLLVIDMQNGFCHDDGSFGGAMGLDISPLKESISGCVKLLETARKNEYPIAFTRYIYNCLLYTSPSPRDKRQSRMPSSA